MDSKQKKKIIKPEDRLPITPQKLNTSASRSLKLEEQKSDDSSMNLAIFFKEQKGQINLWTYLFKNLNTTLGQLITQCEIERKKEFCEGVISTLNNAIEDFMKLIHIIDIESRPTGNKPVAWEVNTHPKDSLNSLEYENFIEDLEDAESVDFALLSQLVTERKMTLDEALVLLIRERALMLPDPEPIENNSYYSKDSAIEYIDQMIKDEGRPDEDISMQRSSTPFKISWSRILQRLSYRYYQQGEQEVQDMSTQIAEKQERAEKFRRDQESFRLEQIKRYAEKQLAAKEKIELKKQQQMFLKKQKYNEADQRYENHLNEIRKKAKVESEKASEIAFITMLENQSQKITIDEKLQDAIVRKNEIQSQFQEKLRNRKLKEDDAKRKRKEQEDEKLQKVRQSQIKRDEAETKRVKRLEDEKKRQCEELSKVSKAVKDRKENSAQSPTWQRKISKLKHILTKDIQNNIQSSKQQDSLGLDLLSSDDEQERPIQRLIRSLPHQCVTNPNMQAVDTPILFFNLEQKQKLQQKIQKINQSPQDEITKTKKKKSKKNHKEKPKKEQQDSLPTRSFRSHSEPFIERIGNEYRFIRKARKLEMPPLIRAQDDYRSDLPPRTEKSEEEPVQYYRLCQICNTIIHENESDLIHLTSNSHKQTKTYYNLNSNQDDILLIKGNKDELINNRFNAIRKRCQKIKLKIQKKSLILENQNLFQGTKETMSHNKQVMQKICNALDRQLSNQIKDLDQIETLFKDLLKILANSKEQRENDLNVLRQLKFMPIVMELFKKVAACRKHEYPQFLAIIGVVTEILYQFCQIYDNRTYLIVGNRILPILDFLYSLLATKPTKFIYSFAFVPQLFQTLSLLIKHKLPRDPLNDQNAQEIQEDLIEYMFCSGMFHKMKLRLQCFEKDYINSEGQIPLALVKSVTFLESVTNYHGFDILGKPVYELPTKPNKNFQKHVTFVLDETDMFGIIHLMSQMIVGEGVSIKNNKMIPQTTLSFLQVGIKTLNNIARLNLQVFQEHMNNQQNRQESHMIMLSLLIYCKESMQDELKELLNELILMIGYFSVLNTQNQNSVRSGLKQISILHNLCDLPPHFYIDKSLVNVLFPTLICCVFRNNQNMEIVLNDNSKDYFVKFISREYKELELHPEQESDDKQSFMQRSPSISSTNSSQNSIFPHSSAGYYKLCQRFPIRFYLESLREFNEFQESK